MPCSLLWSQSRARHTLLLCTALLTPKNTFCNLCRGHANGAPAVAAGGEREGAGAQAAAPADLAERLLRAECKVVDFGNACWVHKQFTTDIQTRQYRCPEARRPQILRKQIFTDGPIRSVCVGNGMDVCKSIPVHSQPPADESFSICSCRLSSAHTLPLGRTSSQMYVGCRYLGCLIPMIAAFVNAA